MSTDPNDPDYKEAKRELQEQEARRRNDWQNVMESDSGKRVIAELLEQSGYKQSPFAKHNSEMCRNVGRGDQGRYIETQLITLCPKAYLDLLENGAKLFVNDHPLINVGDHHDN